MDIDIPKEDLQVMQLLVDLQDPVKFKQAEEEFNNVPMSYLIPPLVRIIERRIENPEETNYPAQRIMCQSAAIHLKNSLWHRYKTKVANYFKDKATCEVLLEKLVQILIPLDDELIVPHLALTILSILIGISAEGPLIVLTISEIYKKITNNEGSYLHIKLGIESIYEILSYYSKDFDVIEDIQKLNFLWEDNFIGCRDQVIKVMDEAQVGKDSRLLKEIFVFVMKIVMKVFKVIGKEACYKTIECVKQTKTDVFRKALENAPNITEEEREADLKVIHTLHKLEIYAVEYIALEKFDLDMYIDIAKYYSNVSFETENLNEIKRKFLDDPNNISIEFENYELAQILAQGIRFHKNILDNPLFWTADMLFNDSGAEVTQKVENELISYYNDDKITQIWDSIISNYLPIDKRELENWQEDPILYYFQSKELDSDSLLRETSVEFIQALKMRFPDFLIKYTKDIINVIKKDFTNINSEVPTPYMQKEALFSFLQQAADLEEDLDQSGFLILIEKELESDGPFNNVLKRRMILILASVSYYFSRLENKEYICEMVEKVVKIFKNEPNPCIRLTCIYFFHQFYDDYYLLKDTFERFIPEIMVWTWEFLLEVRKATENMQAVHEILSFLSILTQKYPEICQEYIEKFFMEYNSLDYVIKRELAPVIRQLLAIIEEDRITADLCNFSLRLLFDIHHPPVQKDVFINEEGLKLLLVYLRRLQNYSKEQANPFKIDLATFQLNHVIIENLDFDEDDMLNIFLVLEEMHFSLPYADFTEINEKTVMEVYQSVFHHCFELANTNENAYIVLLSCYFASTLVISNNNDQIIQVTCEVRDKVKTDIVDKLIGEPTMDINGQEFKEKPDEYHRHYINGFLTLFACLAWKDNQLWVIPDVCSKPLEIQFIRILTLVGHDYMSNIENLFDENQEDSFDEDQKEAMYMSVTFSAVYLFYAKLIESQGNDVSKYIDLTLKANWEALLTKVIDMKDDMIEISQGIFICAPLKNLTKEADTSLLIDVPVKRKILSKTKTNYIFSSFLTELNLFKILVQAE